MKISLVLIVLNLSCQVMYSQRLNISWMLGEVHFKNGDIIKGKLNITNESLEGSLIVQKEEKITAYSPLIVDQIFIYDTLMNDTLAFESVNVKLDGYGSKKMFLNLLLRGSKYSLYKKGLYPNYINPSVDSLRVIKERLIELYTIDKDAMFFVSKNDHTYLVSTPKGDPQKRKFKVEKSILMEIFDEERSVLKRFIRENRLNPIRLYDMKELISYADSLSMSRN